jgi:hypothetical protein
MTSSCFQNKSALKGQRFQDTEDIQKKKKWQWHWKLFQNKSSKNVSKSGSITGLSEAAWGEYFKGDSFQ